MNNIKFYILGVVVFIIQLLISEYVNIWPMLYIAVYPILLIITPYNTNRFLNLITAFLLGLLIDLTADGVLGLNAAAATAISFFKNPIMQLLFSKVSLEKISETPWQSVGEIKFAQLCGVCYAVFFIFYICLDGWACTSFAQALLRFLINVAANTIIAFILWKTLVIRMFR